MNIEEIREKAFQFKESFFWGDINIIEKFYSLKEGIFLVVKTEEEKHEVLWAVNNISDLKKALDIIAKDFNQFIFRYGKPYDELISMIDSICKWGYSYQYMHVGYRLNLLDQTYELLSSYNVEYLEETLVDEVIEIEKSLFELYQATKEEYLQWIKNKEVFVIKLNQLIVGFMIMTGMDTSQCFIRNIGIKSEYQGQSLGQYLLKFGLNEAKKMGCEKCFLWVEKDKKAARHVYEKLGFRIDKNEAEAVFVKE